MPEIEDILQAGIDAANAQEETTSADGSATAPAADNPLAADKVAALEAEVREELGEEAAPEKEEEQKPESKGDRLKKLVDSKYGGDSDKFVDGLYEQWNSTAALKEELDALRKEFAAARQQAPAMSDDDMPQIQEVKQEASLIEKRINSESAGRARDLESLGNIALKIERLKGEAAGADAYDKSRLQERIEQLEGKQDDIKGRLSARAEKLEELAHQQKLLDFRMNRAKEAVRDHREKENLRAQARQAVQQETLKTFTNSAEAAMNETGVPNDSGVREHILQTVRAETYVYLQSLGNDHELVDISDFVKERVKKHSDMYGFAKNADFKRFSKEKLEAANGGAPKPAPKATPPVKQTAPASVRQPKEKAWTPEFVRARAAKILG